MLLQNQQILSTRIDPSAAIVFSGRDEMPSGASVLLWPMQDGALQGQKDNSI